MLTAENRLQRIREYLDFVSKGPVHYLGTDFHKLHRLVLAQASASTNKNPQDALNSLHNVISPLVQPESLELLPTSLQNYLRRVERYLLADYHDWYVPQQIG